MENLVEEKRLMEAMRVFTTPSLVPLYDMK